MCCEDVERLRDQLDTAREMHASAMKTIENMKPKGTTQMLYKGQPVSHAAMERAVAMTRELEEASQRFIPLGRVVPPQASFGPIIHGSKPQAPSSVLAYVKEVRVDPDPFRFDRTYTAGRVSMVLEMDGSANVSAELMRAVTGGGRVRLEPA